MSCYVTSIEIPTRYMWFITITTATGRQKTNPSNPGKRSLKVCHLTRHPTELSQGGTKRTRHMVKPA